MSMTSQIVQGVDQNLCFYQLSFELFGETNLFCSFVFKFTTNFTFQFPNILNRINNIRCDQINKHCIVIYCALYVDLKFRFGDTLICQFCKIEMLRWSLYH